MLVRSIRHKRSKVDYANSFYGELPSTSYFDVALIASKVGKVVNIAGLVRRCSSVEYL